MENQITSHVDDISPGMFCLKGREQTEDRRTSGGIQENVLRNNFCKLEEYPAAHQLAL